MPPWQLLIRPAIREPADALVVRIRGSNQLFRPTKPTVWALLNRRRYLSACTSVQILVQVMKETMTGWSTRPLPIGIFRRQIIWSLRVLLLVLPVIPAPPVMAAIIPFVTPASPFLSPQLPPQHQPLQLPASPFSPSPPQSDSLSPPMAQHDPQVQAGHSLQVRNHLSLDLSRPSLRLSPLPSPLHHPTNSYTPPHHPPLPSPLSNSSNNNNNNNTYFPFHHPPPTSDDQAPAAIAPALHPPHRLSTTPPYHPAQGQQQQQQQNLVIMEDLDWSALAANNYSYTMDAPTRQTWAPDQVDTTPRQQAQNHPIHPHFSTNQTTHPPRRPSSTTQHGNIHQTRHREGESTTTGPTPDLNLGDSPSWNSVMTTTMGPPQGYPLEHFYFPEQEAQARRDPARRPAPLRHSRSLIGNDRRHPQHPPPPPSPQEREQERYALMQLEQMRAVEEAHRRNSLPEMGLDMGMGAHQEDEYLQHIAAFHHHQQQRVQQQQQQGQYFEATPQPTHHRQHLIHHNNNLPLSHTRQQARTVSPLHPHFPPHQQVPPPHRHMGTGTGTGTGEDPRSPLGAQVMFPSPPPQRTDSRRSSTDMDMGMGVVKYDEAFALGMGIIME